MDKFYRDLIEPASLPSSHRLVDVRKKYFGKIVLTVNELEEKYRVFDINVKEELFHNDVLKERVSKELSSVITFFLDKYRIKRGDKVLVAALGNDKISADSIGCAVCDKLTVTSHLYSEPFVKARYGDLSAVKCGVSGNTGIESFEILSCVAHTVKPKIIIAIDALASNSVTRLSNTVQITDRGISPGGGVGNEKPALNADALGCPVIAVGVPLVMYAVKILKEFLPDTSTVDATSLSHLVVTAKEIDFLVSDFSTVIAEGINRSVHYVE